MKTVTMSISESKLKSVFDVMRDSFGALGWEYAPNSNAAKNGLARIKDHLGNCAEVNVVTGEVKYDIPQPNLLTKYNFKDCDYYSTWVTLDNGYLALFVDTDVNI